MHDKDIVVPVDYYSVASAIPVETILSHLLFPSTTTVLHLLFLLGQSVRTDHVVDVDRDSVMTVYDYSVASPDNIVSP